MRKELNTLESVNAIRFTRKHDSAPIKIPEKRCHYLASDALCARHILSAHFLNICPTTIEIGGIAVTIVEFLASTTRDIIVFDPWIDEETVPRDLTPGRRTVYHIRGRFNDFEWEITKPCEYGVVMLGLELEGLSDDDFDMLFKILSNAKVVVLEYPPSWEFSAEQFRRICDNIGMQEKFHYTLDLTGNDVGDLSNSWPPRLKRELHVFMQHHGLEMVKFASRPSDIDDPRSGARGK